MQTREKNNFIKSVNVFFMPRVSIVFALFRKRSGTFCGIGRPKWMKPWIKFELSPFIDPNVERIFLKMRGRT